MPTTTDSALDSLFLPLQGGQVAWPTTKGLFLRARFGRAMRAHGPDRLVCEQSFKPDADALISAGFTLQGSDADKRYPLVLALPPRQRDEARGLLARAVTLLQPGGRVIVSTSNNEGARSGAADLEALIGPVSSLSKHKCRVCWSAPLEAQVNRTLLQQWLQLDAPRPIGDMRFVSRPGVFAWDRIDAASTLLAKHLPTDLRGRAADLGAGFGYLAVELLTRCAGITALDLYEAEARALDLARDNLRLFSQRATLGFHWHDVTQGLAQRYQLIICNPPFHKQHRADRPDIGRRFIEVASAALAPGGQLWLVANRHLPYEGVLNAGFGHTRIVAQQDGFKIIAATKAARNETNAPSRANSRR